jgi:predicted oxidoreductase
MEPGVMLVCLGGLTVDPYTLNVVDDEWQPIEGLYAAGNAMGGRILVDYPVVVAGISHSTALTYGRIAGQSVGKA